METRPFRPFFIFSSWLPSEVGAPIYLPCLGEFVWSIRLSLSLCPPHTHPPPPPPPPHTLFRCTCSESGESICFKMDFMTANFDFASFSELFSRIAWIMAFLFVCFLVLFNNKCMPVSQSICSSVSPCLVHTALVHVFLFVFVFGVFCFWSSLLSLSITGDSFSPKQAHRRFVAYFSVRYY